LKTQAKGGDGYEIQNLAIGFSIGASFGIYASHGWSCGRRERLERESHGDGHRGKAAPTCRGPHCGYGSRSRVRCRKFDSQAIYALQNPDANRRGSIERGCRRRPRAEQSGDMAKAKTYYEKLVVLAQNADSERPELKETKTFLAKQ
jgi:hypothetical protein